MNKDTGTVLPIPVKVVNKSGFENSKITYATDGSSCVDLLCSWSNGPIELKPKSSAVVATGFYIQLPPGYEGQVRPRSGLAFKQDVVAVLGTIDADYRGEIHVKLFNFGNKCLNIVPGDRIAQLAIAKIERPSFVFVEDESMLEATERGNGGFGHTGR